MTVEVRLGSETVIADETIKQQPSPITPSSSLIFEVGRAINRVATIKSLYPHDTVHAEELMSLANLIANTPGAAEALTNISKRPA